MVAIYSHDTKVQGRQRLNVPTAQIQVNSDLKVSILQIARSQEAGFFIAM